jgi:MFS family permease
VPVLGKGALRPILTRATRGFADGVVSVMLASWLGSLGFSTVQIGAIVTATLLGSAALTLSVGILGHRFGRRAVLLGAAALMVATGIGFWGVTSFWPLLVIAFVGTINPSSGDVTLFLPTEQAVLADSTTSKDRTFSFAVYNLAGNLTGALGALAAGLPGRMVFLLYAALGLLVALQYLRLPRAGEVSTAAAPLQKSRAVVLRLSLLFCLDSFGGGFVVQSLLALWLYRRFHLSVEQAGAFFFAVGILNAASQFFSSKVAARIGHVRTMVYTHLPASLLLLLAGCMPAAPLAIALLLIRSLISQMDVPARQAYVMAVVPREERAAASSVTNVPRALAAAISPVIAGALLESTSFGWPLILGGLLKASYDLLLFNSFSRLKPLDEP